MKGISISNGRKKECLFVIGVIIQLICLGFAGSLFLQPKQSFSFPYEKLEGKNSIIIENFKGQNGYYLDNSMDYEDASISSPSMRLSKGTYQVSINYITETDGQTYSVTGENSNFDISAGKTSVALKAGDREEIFTLWVKSPIDGFQIKLDFGGHGYLFVTNIAIQETNAWKRINFFMLFLLFMAFDIIYILVCKGFFLRLSVANKKILLGLIMISLFSSYPILSYYLYKGHDLQFHLLRIQGICDGILAGEFPVKIQPNWMGGYGYGVSVFYGDIFLYLPALFVLIGFQLQTAYKIFLVLVNILTCISSYYCFTKIFKSNKIGILASMLYVLAPYRLSNLYIRSAVGEYTAILFLPLIFYGLYRIFTEEEKECQKGVFAAVIGFSGLIQCHILSCEIVGFLTLVFCIILWKKVIVRNRFLSLLQVVIYVTIINLWFLVPFVDYMSESFRVTQASEGTIQGAGLFINQLLSFFPIGHGYGFGVRERIDRVDIMPLSIGSALLLGGGLFLYYSVDRKKEKIEEFQLSKLCLIVSAVLVWMTTIWFPWDRLQEMNSVFKVLIQKLQFPWRLLGATILLLVVVCCGFVKLLSKKSKERAEKVFYLLGLLSIISSGWLMSSIVNENDVAYFPDESRLDTYFIVQGEYIPTGTNVMEMMNKELIFSENIGVVEYNKSYNNVWVYCINNTVEDGKLEIPLLYYKGYIAYDERTGERLQVFAGTNNRVSVTIPAGFDSSIHVEFSEPWYWRVAEIISVVFLAGILSIYIIKRKQEKITAGTIYPKGTAGLS